MRLPLLMSIGLTISSLSMQAQLKYPSTTKDATSYNLHGNTIKDEYMWLENDTAAKTKAWVREQNKFTNDYLNKIPYRNTFVKRITELMDYEKLGVPTQEGEYTVYYKNNGGCVFICTHDVELATEVADRVIVLSQGQIIADAPTNEVLSNRQVLNAGGLTASSLLDVCQEINVPPCIAAEEVKCYVSSSAVGRH